MEVHPGPIDGLLAAFHDRDWAVREAATESLLRLGPGTAEELIARLDRVETGPRALGAMGAAAAPALVACAAERLRPRQAWKAASLLTRIGEPALAAIAAHVRQGDQRPGEAVVFALGTIGVQMGERARTQVVPLLVEVLAGADADARVMAAAGLERNAAAAADAAPALVRAIVAPGPARNRRTPGWRTAETRRQEDRVREPCVAALIGIGAAAVPALVAALGRAEARAPAAEEALLRAARAIAAANPEVADGVLRGLLPVQRQRLGLVPARTATPLPRPAASAAPLRPVPHHAATLAPAVPARAAVPVAHLPAPVAAEAEGPEQGAPDWDGPGEHPLDPREGILRERRAYLTIILTLIALVLVLGALGLDGLIELLSQAPDGLPAGAPPPVP